MGSVSWRWLSWWACFLGKPRGKQSCDVTLFSSVYLWPPGTLSRTCPILNHVWTCFLMYNPVSGTVFFKTEHLVHDYAYFVWQDLLQGFSTQPSSLQLLPGLLCGLTLHQSLSLGQKVCYKDLRWHPTHINQRQRKTYITVSKLAEV